MPETNGSGGADRLGPIERILEAMVRRQAEMQEVNAEMQQKIVELEDNQAEIQQDIVTLYTFAPSELKETPKTFREFILNTEFDHPSPSML